MKQNFNKNTKRRVNRPIILPIVFTGKDKNDREYDIESCKNIIKDLQDNNVFSKLSISLGIQKSLLEDPDSRGTLTIARIQSIDTDIWAVSVIPFTANNKYADALKDFVVVPHVRIGRDSNEVLSILRFEIVKAMDA